VPTSPARVAADPPAARRGQPEPQAGPCLSRLREWYPDGQFLHLIRRPHDVAASVANYSEISLHSVRTTPVISAWHWRKSYRSVRAQGDTLGADRYLLLRYEDLVDDPRAKLREVVDFLGESQDGLPQMLEFYRQPLVGHTRAHMDRAHQPVAKDEKSRGERSLPEATRRDIDWICRREMAALGYTPLAQGKAGLLRKLALGAKCLAYDVAWAGLRASRRLRGQL
jgi:hypothetical protein